MTDKRFKKLDTLTKELKNYKTVKIYGPKNAEVTIIGWGSTKGPIREAMRSLIMQGIELNYLQILYLNPFPADKVKEMLEKSKKIIVIENNKTSQLAGLIREQILAPVDYSILKYDGRPFNPEALERSIKELL